MTLDNYTSDADPSPVVENKPGATNPESAVGVGTLQAHEIMSTWTDDASWKLPQRCDLSFALREKCPDVVAHLVRAKHFSARDLRTILERVRSDADHRDPFAAYNAILDITERKPWLWPHLESLAMTQRTHDKPHVRRKGQNGVVYSKFPLHKMRLDLNKHLKSKLPELVAGSSFDPEIGFAAFAEFSVQQYFQTIEGWNSSELAENISNAITPFASLKYLSEIAGKCTSPAHWLSFGKVVCEASDFRPDITNAAKLSLLRQTLDGLFQTLHDDSPPLAFETISEIAARCALMTRSLEGEWVVELQRILSELSISADISSMPMSRLEVIRRVYETGALETLLRELQSNASAENELVAMRAQIAQASADDDFDLVAELNSSAKSLKERVASVSESLETQLRAVQRFVADPQAGPEDLQRLFEIAERQQSIPVDIAGSDDLDARQEYPDTEADFETDIDEDLLVFEDEEFDSHVEYAPSFDLPIDQREEGISDTSPVTSHTFIVDEPIPPSPEAPWEEENRSLPETIEPTPQIDTSSVPVSDAWQNGSVEDSISESFGDAISEAVLIDLFSRNLLGVAADVAGILEESGIEWPIEASVLSELLPV